MRVELLIGPASENLVAVAGQDSELKETVDHHSNRRVVHFVEGGTPTDGREAGLLSRQHDFVDLFLFL